jgi:bla regulator protein BlaR1
MYDFIKILFLMSLKTSILIFIIVLIKKIFNKYINAKIHFLVWLLIFIPLLIPVLPQSHLSIYNLSPIFQKEITVTPKISINDNYNTYNNESIDNYKNQWIKFLRCRNSYRK